MSWSLGKNIRLRSQNRFISLEDINDSEDIIRLGNTLKRITKPQVKRV